MARESSIARMKTSYLKTLNPYQPNRRHSNSNHFESFDTLHRRRGTAPLIPNYSGTNSEYSKICRGQFDQNHVPIRRCPFFHDLYRQWKRNGSGQHKSGIRYAQYSDPLPDPERQLSNRTKRRKNRISYKVYFLYSWIKLK